MGEGGGGKLHHVYAYASPKGAQGIIRSHVAAVVVVGSCLAPNQCMH